jgi:hypothetical protein
MVAAKILGPYRSFRRVNLKTFPTNGIFRVQAERYEDVWGPEPKLHSEMERWLDELNSLWSGDPLKNRFAHPLGHYRETYGSNTLVGALEEIWADDMADEATVIAGILIRAIWDPTFEINLLPPERIDNLVAIRMKSGPAKFVDVARVRTRTWLSRHPKLHFLRLWMKARSQRFDSGLIEGSDARSRIVTNRIGRVIWEDDQVYGGVSFSSRIDSKIVNWAIFDRARVCILERLPLLSYPREIKKALLDLGLTI